MAPRDIPAGVVWSQEIVRAIDQSRALVLVFSSAANESRQVFRELDYADTRGVPMLLFRVQNLEPLGAIRYFIGSTQWLDAWSASAKRSMDLLRASLSQMLKQSVPAHDALTTNQPETAGARESQHEAD
jgi:hypothetical protein